LADHFAEELKRTPRQGDIVPLGPIALLAHRVADGRVTTVGLRLAHDDESDGPMTVIGRVKRAMRRLLARLG
jgi:hypothetical protein